jgi:hypothetical protein
MAQAFNFTYDDTAIREDLLDLIVNIDPEEDQLYVGLQKHTANQPYHQWLTDTLAAVSGTGQKEGFDPAFAARTNPSRKANYTQIISAEFQVTDSERNSNTAGFKDRYTYEMQKAMLEWRRNAEFSIVRNSLVSGTGSASRQMAGVRAQITTTVTNQASVSLSEKMFNDYLQNAWALGGIVDNVYVGATLKRRISGFTNTNTRFVDATNSSVNNVINVYDSDFGRVNIHKHRWVQNSDDTNLNLIGIQQDKWAVAHLDAPHYQEIPRTGYSSKGMIVGELTLEALNEKSSFQTTNLQ